MNRHRRGVAAMELRCAIAKDFGESYVEKYPRESKDVNWNWW